jgi:hypothetical protein
MVALCKRSECAKFGKPISFKYFAELGPSERVNEDDLTFVKGKLAERITHERDRQVKRMKRTDEREMIAGVEPSKIPSSIIENAGTLQSGSQACLVEMDTDFREINDYFEGKFEWIRKRLVKAKELKNNAQAKPESGVKADARGWDKLIEKYRRLLKLDESKLDSLSEKASAIERVLEARIGQVDSSLPVNECELEVEQDLNEDVKGIEELKKQVEILRKQQQECLPRKEKVRSLLDRIQYCATEIKGEETQPIQENTK